MARSATGKRGSRCFIANETHEIGETMKQVVETDETVEPETATKIEEKVKHVEGQVKKKTPLTKELLHELHWGRGFSTYRIAKETGWAPHSVYYHMRKEGVPTRIQKEAQKLQLQHELERARQCVDPSLPELLKDLEVEYTKDGRNKLRSLPPEVRERLKNEALRLREKGGRGYRIVARALGLHEPTVNGWFYPPPLEAQRERALRWQREHRRGVMEYHRRRREEAKEDLVRELGGRCQRCGKTVDAIAVDFHELEKAEEDRGKGFFNTSLGKLWIRSRKTKHREEVLEVIRKKVILLDAICHRKISARKKRLRRRLSREEILYG